MGFDNVFRYSKATWNSATTAQNQVDPKGDGWTSMKMRDLGNAVRFDAAKHLGTCDNVVVQCHRWEFLAVRDVQVDPTIELDELIAMRFDSFT